MNGPFSQSLRNAYSNYQSCAYNNRNNPAQRPEVSNVTSHSINKKSPSYEGYRDIYKSSRNHSDSKSSNSPSIIRIDGQTCPIDRSIANESKDSFDGIFTEKKESNADSSFRDPSYRIMACSAAISKSNSSRQYLADYQPFVEAFRLKNISMQIWKAFALAASMALLEHNKHLDQELRHSQERQDILDDKTLSKYEKKEKIRELKAPAAFNWDRMLRVTHGPMFVRFAGKFYASSVVKKIYELGAFNYFKEKYVDKLTKDVFKSFARKLQKTSDRWLVSRKIFYTSMHASFFMYAATLSTDVIVAMASSIYDLISHRNESKDRMTSSQSFIWLCKKIVLTAISLSSYSAGIAIGGYVGGVDYGATIGALVLEPLISSLFGLVIVL